MPDERSQLESLAQQVIGDVKTVKAGFDVVDTVAFVVLCLRGIALLYECFQLYPDGAATAARNPTFVQRFWIHRKIKTILNALDDPISYQEVYRGVLKLGRTVTPEQISAAVAEVRSGR